MARMWMVRGEGGSLYDAFRERGVAAIGWNQLAAHAKPGVDRKQLIDWYKSAEPQAKHGTGRPCLNPVGIVDARSCCPRPYRALRQDGCRNETHHSAETALLASLKVRLRNWASVNSTARVGYVAGTTPRGSSGC